MLSAYYKSGEKFVHYLIKPEFIQDISVFQNQRENFPEI